MIWKPHVTWMVVMTITAIILIPPGYDIGWGGRDRYLHGVAIYHAYHQDGDDKHTWLQGAVERAGGYGGDLLPWNPPPDLIDVPANTTTGSRGLEKVLVLMVEFLDRSHNSTHDTAYFNNLIFDTTYGSPSLRNYISECSYQNTLITGSVAPEWILLNRPMAYYGTDDLNDDDGDGRISDDEYVDIDQLITDALTNAEASGIYLPDYDSDGDGLVDHLIVIHAGAGQEVSGVNSDIYSRSASLSLPYHSSSSNVGVDRYVLVSEDSPLGVIAQKFLLDLGAPLTLDRDGSSDGLGVWDVMAHGFRLSQGSMPPHPCAYVKYVLGWLTPECITMDMAYTLSPLATSADAMLLPLRAGEDGHMAEFIMVEYRKNTGFDRDIPGSGVLIYHIDLRYRNNDDEDRPLIRIEEADGGNELAEYGGDMGSVYDAFGVVFNHFSDDTTPSARDNQGIRTGWSLTNIELQPNGAQMNVAGPDIDIAFYRTKTSSHYLELGDEFKVEAGVINYGHDTASGTLDIKITPLGSDVTLHNESLPLSLSPWSCSEHRFTYRPERSGRYELHLELNIEGDDIRENNRYTTSLFITTFLFQDDVEEGNKGWTSYSTLPLVSEGWHIVTVGEVNGDAYSGNHSWWCGFDTTGMYQRATDFILESKPIEVGGGEATLYFHQKYDINTGPLFGLYPDSGFVEVSVDGGGTWETLRTYQGTASEWGEEAILLSPYLEPNGTEVKIRFRINSNLLFLAGGWYVDDISIVGEGLYHAIDLSPVPSHAYLYPAETTNVFLHLSNLGNSAESVTLGYTVDNLTAVVALPYQNIVLEPWSTHVIKAAITLSPQSPAGTIGLVRFTAISDNSTGAWCNFSIEVGAVVDMNISVERSELMIYPPQPAMTNITVRNLGNIDIRVDSSTTIPPYFTVTLSEDPITVPAFGTHTVSVSYTARPDTEPGKAFSTEIVFKADTAGMSGARIINSTVAMAINISVGESHQIELSTPISTIFMGPKDYKTVEVDVINMGNSIEVLKIEPYSSAEEMEVWLGTDEVSVLPGQSYPIILNLKCGRDIDAKSLSVSLSAIASSGVSAVTGLDVNILYPDIDLALTNGRRSWRAGESGVVAVRVANVGEFRGEGVTVDIYLDGTLYETLDYDVIRPNEEVTKDIALRLGEGRHIIRAVARCDTTMMGNGNNVSVLRIDVSPNGEEGGLLGLDTTIDSVGAFLVVLIILVAMVLSALVLIIKRGGD